MNDLDAHARALIDANLYVTLGTSDAHGTPWVSPVFFATADYATFYWVSGDDAEHSRNIAGRPEVSMVIFNSQVPAYHGRAVYLSATAIELAVRDLERGLGVYPGPASRGAPTIERADVTAPSRYRLYEAAVTQAFVLCPRERGQPCLPHSIAADHRTEVTSASKGSQSGSTRRRLPLALSEERTQCGSAQSSYPFSVRPSSPTTLLAMSRSTPARRSRTSSPSRQPHRIRPSSRPEAARFRGVGRELVGAVDSNREGGADLAHAGVAQAAQAADEHGDRHAFDRVEVDCRTAGYRIVASLQHYFADEATNRRRTRRYECTAVPRDHRVARQDHDRSASDPLHLAPPHFTACGKPAHDDAAARRKDARSPHSSGSSSG